MNSINFSFDNTKKKCAGRDCERLGTRILKLRFLNKIAIFCDVCAEDLLSGDLASKIEDENGAERIGQHRKQKNVNFG